MTKGVTRMTRKSPMIKQGKVTELITGLASLPEREKDPDDPISLSEVFRTKEYTAEIKAALKKGYTFDDLAEIFTERCGVAISARQIKYHFTRGKNRGMKGKSGRRIGETGASGSRASSADSLGKDAAEGAKENVIAADSGVNTSSKGAEFVFENGTATGTERNASTGASSFNSKQKES
jgi:hypothetical protein